MGEPLKEYSSVELAKRNGITMPEVWIGYKGNIYDVTSSDLFENGKHYQHLNGTDLTDSMPDAPHIDEVMEKFDVVGRIEGSAPVGKEQHSKPTGATTSSYVPPAITKQEEEKAGSSKIVYKPYSSNKTTSNFSPSPSPSYSPSPSPASMQPKTSSSPTKSDSMMTKTIPAAVNKPKKSNEAVKATFSHKEKISGDVFRFYFNIDSSKFTFTPGQYVKFSIKIKGTEHERSYSISSLPNNDVVEFVIQKKKAGVVSNYLINKLKENDTVTFRGPFGDIAFRGNDKNLSFICTDVGIGPIRSVILDILKNNRTQKNIYLIYGNRNISDLLFKEEWILLEQLYPNFYLLPVFSQEDSPPTWGYKGYVHDIYLDEDIFNKNDQFYIVGWQRMVKDTKQKLKENLCLKENINTQLYI